MEISEIKVGQQVSSKEMKFVNEVVAKIRNSGYLGPIRVVGSREKNSRISLKMFNGNSSTLSENEAGEWLNKINKIAQDRDISAGEIGKIGKYLPKDTPTEIRDMFESNSGHLDSDLDLAVDEELVDINLDHVDDPTPKGSGLVIEIYPPGDNSYLNRSPFDY